MSCLLALFRNNLEPGTPDLCNLEHPLHRSETLGAQAVIELKNAAAESREPFLQCRSREAGPSCDPSKITT